MGVKLSKGGNVNLSKAAPGLKKIRIGLGWDARVTDGAQFDLDASAFILGAGDKVRGENDLVFYNNLEGANGGVKHLGDNRTGQGTGDDEGILVDLALVPADVLKVAVTVTIDDATTRKQNFGQVSNAYVRVVNEETGEELARYDLSEDYSVETALTFGELYRAGTEWKFKAVGAGHASGLAGLCTQFGVATS